MRVERLNVGAWTDRAQIYRYTSRVDGEFFGSIHEFSAEPFALLCGNDAEQTEVHAIGALLEIDATDKSGDFVEQQELAGAQIFQRTFAVDAIGADERTLDLKSGVDEMCQRAGVGIVCNTNRKKFSSTNWLRQKSSGREISRRRRVLLRCEEADCIWRCGRCGTLNRS